MYIIVSTYWLPALTSSPFLWNIHRALSQLLSPTERLPHCKQSLLCVWNRRGQHSSPQAPNKDPDSCRNNPDSLWECKPYPLFQGSCLPQGGQSVSLWSHPMPTGRMERKSTSILSVLLCKLCRRSAHQGDIGLFCTCHQNSCWIIRTRNGFSMWNMDAPYLHFQTEFNVLGRSSPALSDYLTTAWPEREHFTD